MKYDLNLTLTYRCNPKTVGITLICELKEETHRYRNARTLGWYNYSNDYHYL